MSIRKQQMLIRRRQMLMISAMSIPVAILAGCGGTSTTTPTITIPTTVDPQVLQNTQMAIQEATVVVQLVTQYAPNSFTPTTLANITTASNSAQALITSISTATPAAAGATTIQQIDTDLNIILTAAGPVLKVVAAADPALAPAVVAYDLIMPLVPSIEAWINSILGLSKTAAARAPLQPLRMSYTLEQSRAIIMAQHAKKN